jgi:hypothetical protein
MVYCERCSESQGQERTDSWNTIPPTWLVDPLQGILNMSLFNIQNLVEKLEESINNICVNLKSFFVKENTTIKSHTVILGDKCAARHLPKR